MYNLVIVESPAKAKTIEGYLPDEYKVVSSVGHIRDLAKTGPGGLGIDVENDYLGKYTFIKGKKKLVNDLKKLAKNASIVYIATDPDREGEAIGWHLADVLELDCNQKNRIYFSEITKNAVLRGITDVKKLDLNLVYSQEGRRKIDRIMGFKLSKLMQKKLKAKSAGRVQSVALLMVVEREDEITKFIALKYDKLFAKHGEQLLEYIDNDKQLDPNLVNDLYQKVEIHKSLKVLDIKKSVKNLKPKPIYTTSSFQQDAINKLFMSSRGAMMAAQKLYEGVKINGELTGLITYMRTDSVRMSTEFIVDINSYVEKTYGKEYCAGYFFKSKSKVSQDAHEGIRPTNLNYSPLKIKDFLSAEQFKIYSLIYDRTIASCMSCCKIQTTNYIFSNDSKINFKKNVNEVLFKGYTVLYHEEIEDLNKDFKFEIGQVCEISGYKITNHQTKPKARYSEASLIKELEENGVGRPSTYSAIIETLKKRNYVTVNSKRFVPSEIGIEVTRSLQKYFNEIINIEYTSKMEADLDLVAHAQATELEVLDSFYHHFVKVFEDASEKMQDAVVKKTGEECPKCQSEMVFRSGRYGDFEACGNFPKCRYIKINQDLIICKCKKCGSNILQKKTKRGKVFYGCDNYPKCDFAVWNKEDLDSN